MSERGKSAVLGEFDPNAEFDVVDQGVEAGFIPFSGLGEDSQHVIEPGRIHPSNEQVTAQRFELIEQPLPATNRPPSTLERIADRLQGKKPLDARNAGGHGNRG